jgi:hypothetical protein
MATLLEQVRQKYPQYNHLSNAELADSLAEKFYSGLPKEQAYQKVGYEEEAPYIPSTAGEAFGKAAITTPVQAAQNLLSKSAPIMQKISPLSAFSLASKKIPIPSQASQVLPKALLSTEKEQTEHPIASGLGSLAGFLPLGAGTIAAGRAIIPGAANLISRYSPSLLGRAGIGAVEGGGLGALYSPKGQELPGMLEGAAIGAPLNAFLPPLIGSIGASLKRPKLSTEYEDLVKQSDLTNEQLEQIKSQAKEQFGKSEPESLLRSAQQKSDEVQNLSQIAGEPLRQTENILPTPQETKLQTLVPNAEKNVNLTHDYISKYLGKNETHDVNIAREITKNVAEIKNIGSQLYNNLDRSLAEKNVVIPRTPDLMQIENDLQKLLSKSNLSPDEIDNFRQAIIRAESQGTDIIPATDYLQNYRITRDMATEFRKKGYKEQASAQEKEMQPYYREQADKFQNLANRMIKLLKEQVGPEDAQNIDNATNYWRDNVIPLQKNKIVWQSNPKNFGRINSANIIQEMRGDNAGNSILRNMAKQNPAIAKNLLGQRFAKKPSELLDVDNETKQYIDALPELKNLLNVMKKANKRLENAKIEANYLKEDIERIEKRLIQDAKNQKEAKIAREKIDKLREEIKNEINYAKELRRLSEDKTLKEKQRRKIKKELNDINVKIKKRNKVIKSAAKLTGYAILGKSFYSSLKSLFS